PEEGLGLRARHLRRRGLGDDPQTRLRRRLGPHPLKTRACQRLRSADEAGPLTTQPMGLRAWALTPATSAPDRARATHRDRAASARLAVDPPVAARRYQTMFVISRATVAPIPYCGSTPAHRARSVAKPRSHAACACGWSEGISDSRFHSTGASVYAVGPDSGSGSMAFHVEMPEGSGLPARML